MDPIRELLETEKEAQNIIMNAHKGMSTLVSHLCITFIFHWQKLKI